MAVKRRQKDDNHGTLEDKSQGPLVSDKRRAMAHRGDEQMRHTLSLTLPSLICIRGPCIRFKTKYFKLEQYD